MALKKTPKIKRPSKAALLDQRLVNLEQRVASFTRGYTESLTAVSVRLGNVERTSKSDLNRFEAIDKRVDQHIADTRSGFKAAQAVDMYIVTGMDLINASRKPADGPQAAKTMKTGDEQTDTVSKAEQLVYHKATGEAWVVLGKDDDMIWVRKQGTKGPYDRGVYRASVFDLTKAARAKQAEPVRSYRDSLDRPEAAAQHPAYCGEDHDPSLKQQGPIDRAMLEAIFGKGNVTFLG